jgi:crotonobetainyl-CoA:carnitine CoA-transferase CaiB-like acyl-CoA transferase
VSRRLLSGVRILDLSVGFAGPYCGKILADLGADVIKAEPPDGDPSRARGPFPRGEPHPERSGFFLYLNAGKRGIVLDLAQAGGRETLLDLAATVDVVLESCPPGELDRLDVGFEALRARNPGLVLVSVTPFGQWGPHSSWRGSDLIASHGSGFAYVFPSHQVDSPDLPPLNPPVHAVELLAGEVAAAAATHGLLAVQRTGRAVHLDVSVQEAVAAENYHRYNVVDRTGAVRRQFAATPQGGSVGLLPCRDGWVAISPREEDQWARWLQVLGTPAWGSDPRFADRGGRERHWVDLYPLLAAWSRERTKAEVFEAAQEHRIACLPLGTGPDLMDSAQLAARGFLQSVDDPELGGLTLPGVPYQISGVDQRPPSRAPRLGQHQREVMAELRESAPPRDGTPASDSQPLYPLRGVRVVDFSWVIGGPISTKYLAALGADVIKIESRSRPDLSHRNPSWEELNLGKRSLTLDMKHDEAREIARRLIAVSDVVVENFSTGVMERLGLGYPALRALNPRIILASLSSFGRTGPDRELRAYGTLIQCFTGWAGLSAHPGLSPRTSGGIWTDPLAAILVTSVVLAAIRRQRAHGEGCAIDLSMVEATIAALPEPILAWSMNGEVVRPRGNRHPIFAPRGCYPADGDDTWVALSVQSDAEWATLCQLMAREDLLAETGLSTVAGRQTEHDRIDAEIAAWTRRRPAAETADLLQANGIAAAPTLNPTEVPADPQLAARGFFGPVPRLDGGSR